MSDEGEGRQISIEQLMSLRSATEAVSKWLRAELQDRLETMRPLLAPKRLLGEYVRGTSKHEVPKAERAFDKLKAAYVSAAGALELPKKLDSPLDPIPNKLSLCAWEYTHKPAGGEALTIKSPVSWVLLHDAPIGLDDARQAGADGKQNDANLRKFAIHALVMKMIFEAHPGLGRLLAATGFSAGEGGTPELGKLPLLRVTSCVPTFRPADDVILNATRLSGVPIFEELVDVDALGGLEDPLRKKVAELAG